LLVTTLLALCLGFNLPKTFCNGVEYVHSNSVKMRCGPPTPNAWVVIHQRFADCIESGKWNAAEQRQWYEAEWDELISSCGQCRKNWNEIDDSIDWQTAQSAYDSLFNLHNRVSREHAGKSEITREQCDSLYLQQASLDKTIVAVTSLAPDRLERQTECLNTWRRFGLSILAVQPKQECNKIRDEYPQLSDVVPIHSGSPPTISGIIKAGLVHSDQILLINSDIEIHGQQSILKKALNHGMAIGVRHNYTRHWWQSERENLGIDAFSFDRKSAKKLPNTPFRIGKPWWDYWVLDHFRKVNQSWIAEPLFFHRHHSPSWNDDDWDNYGNEFAKIHGKKYTRETVGEFRRQFPHSG
jgi:hypothetical protein